MYYWWIQAMKSFHSSTLPGIGLTLIAMTLATNTHAEIKIFKSVDANGNVTYGDQPTDEAVDFELIEMEPTPRTSDGADLDKRLDRMAAATERLKSDRKARESERVTEQPPANTVVYYPAYQDGNSGAHYHRDDEIRHTDLCFRVRRKPGLQGQKDYQVLPDMRMEIRPGKVLDKNPSCLRHKRK